MGEFCLTRYYCYERLDGKYTEYRRNTQEREKEMHQAIFFLLENLALQLGLGERCQPEGKQLRGSSFFAYESGVPLRFSAAPCISFE